MVTESEVQELLNELFEQQALSLGGLVALHGLDDELVWRLVKNLDVIRSRFMRRIRVKRRNRADDTALLRPCARPHPAIQHFLSRLRR
ncbi:MAG: hypothetical protein L6R28_03815 [Planctomycetes bacterium]|nr:hypothetical protein [Planctomycetota bacterium]